MMMTMMMIDNDVDDDDNDCDDHFILNDKMIVLQWLKLRLSRALSKVC